MKCFFLTGVMNGRLVNGRLEEVVSDTHVTEIAMRYSNWELLHSFLGLSYAQNQGIYRTSSDHEIQGMHVLQEWKQRQGNKASYGALIKAAEKAKQMQLADGVRTLIGINDVTDSSSTHSKECVGLACMHLRHFLYV